MQVRDFTLEAVRDFVFEAAAGGASGVFSHVGRIMVSDHAALRLRIFSNAARHVSRLLKDGLRPTQLKQAILPIAAYI
jgi:hypothetical protein